MDKSLNRGMFNKFESRKICVAGYQCDNSDFDFCIAEHNELPVIKICSSEGGDDCQQLSTRSCTKQTTDKEIKIFVTKNTEGEAFCMEGYSEKYTVVV